MKWSRLRIFIAFVAVFLTFVACLAVFYPTIFADYGFNFKVTAEVVDADTGSPVVGADLRFTNPQNGAQWSCGTTATDGRSDSSCGLLYGRSESEWQFRFGDPPDFAIKIEVLKDGYEAAVRQFQWSRLAGGVDDKVAELGRVALHRLAAPEAK
jgi:hypothetical protein